MKNWQLIVSFLCVAIAVLSVIWGILWMMIAKDLGNKIGFLEQDIIEYKWQLEEVYYICFE